MTIVQFSANGTTEQILVDKSIHEATQSIIDQIRKEESVVLVVGLGDAVMCVPKGKLDMFCVMDGEINENDLQDEIQQGIEEVKSK